MKQLKRRKTLWSALAVICVAFLLLPYLWRKFYFQAPTAAYYKLALALAQSDETKITQLARPFTKQRLRELAVPYGGTSRFGKLMRQTPEVSPVVHMVATVDVFATIDNREFMVQFSWRQGHWVADTAFFWN